MLDLLSLNPSKTSAIRFPINSNSFSWKPLVVAAAEPNLIPDVIDGGKEFTGNFSHPPIPTSESDIFANLESIPTKDFFGHSLNINSTPNIGASNAKNGEILN